MKRTVSFLLLFLLLAFPVFAADGADVVRPGALTGNIDFNASGNDIAGNVSSSSPYLAFTINGSTKYIQQLTSTSTRRFYFDYGWSGSDPLVVSAYDFLTPTNGSLFFLAGQYYRCNVALLNQTSITSVSTLQVSGFHLVDIGGCDFTFYFDRDTALSDVYWRLKTTDFNLNASGTSGIVQNFGFTFLNFQTLTGFSVSDNNQDIVQAIEDQTQHIDDGFQAGVNPEQGKVNSDISGGIADMDSFEDGIYADINDYKDGLDFGFDDFADAGAGLGYIKDVFMMVWNNSPVQPIILSLMMGVALLLLGRGVSAATSSARENYQADRRAERRRLDRERWGR